MADKPLTVREACRRRMPLDGTDAQALEGALAMTERERDDARARIAALEGDGCTSPHCGDVIAVLHVADVTKQVRIAALEHALTITERERDKALASSQIDRQLAEANLTSLRIVGEQRDNLRVVLSMVRECIDEATEDTPDRPLRVVALRAIDDALHAATEGHAP